MAKKTSRKPAGRRVAARTAIRDGWAQAMKALASAEAGVQKQVKTLGTRLEHERKRALKELESRLAAVRARLEKERKVVGKTVDKAVHRALAALDIPSRREIGELTRKVDELSHKIDAYRRRA